MRRLNMIDAFKITTERHRYCVTLERIKNDVNGNPRFKATVVVLDGEDVSCYNAVYSFQGHYFGELKEAEWVIEKFEEETNNE